MKQQFPKVVTPNPSLTALIKVHFAAFLFGLSGIFGALASTDAWVISFGRAFFASLILAAYALIFKIPFRLKKNAHPFFLILSGVSLAIHWLTFFLSIQQSNVAIATLGFATFPAFIVLIEVIILKEPLGKRSLLLLTMVLTGIVLVNPSLDFQSQYTTGLIMGLISAVHFAILAVSNRQLAGHYHPIALSFWQNIIVAICMAFGIFPSIQESTLNNWFWIFMLGLFCTAVSHYFFVSSLNYLRARTAGIIISTEPVYAIIIAWILFGDQPTWGMIIGGVLILTAALLPPER